MEQINYQELKNNCFIAQKDINYFSIRFRIAGGFVELVNFKKVYEIAEKYGKGYIHLTSRQSIEIPFIKLKDIEAVKSELNGSSLKLGACGAKVRTITGCQGSEVCNSGLIDSTALALEFDEKYYGRELPHKFKIGITGCINNCLKAEENDLGVKGGFEPKWDKLKCSFCKICEFKCPGKAIKVEKEAANLVFNKDKCRYCGLCNKNCSSNAWEGIFGYQIFFGGLFGRQIKIGRQLLSQKVFNREELHEIIEKTLKFYKKYGQKKERFRNTLDRVGWDFFEDYLMRD